MVFKSSAGAWAELEVVSGDLRPAVAANGGDWKGSCSGWMGDIGDVAMGNFGCVTVSRVVSFFLRLMGGVDVVESGVVNDLPLTSKLFKVVSCMVAWLGAC